MLNFLFADILLPPPSPAVKAVFDVSYYLAWILSTERNLGQFSFQSQSAILFCCNVSEGGMPSINIYRKHDYPWTWTSLTWPSFPGTWLLGQRLSLSSSQNHIIIIFVDIYPSKDNTFISFHVTCLSISSVIIFLVPSKVPLSGGWTHFVKAKNIMYYTENGNDKITCNRYRVENRVAVAQPECEGEASLGNAAPAMI